MAGYVSVSSGSIKADLLNYPLPVIRVTRLAVDKRYQKKGFGKILLRFVLDLSVEQKDRVGCIGVVVDAKNESVEFYEKYGFKTIKLLFGKLDVRPYLTTMYLSIKTIQKAQKG